MLVSCVGDDDSGQSGDGTVRLTMWIHDGAEREVIPFLIERFEALNPGIKVDTIEPPEFDYFNFLVASSLTGSLPDVFDVDAPNLAFMVYLNALLPYSEIDGLSDADLQEFVGDFYPSIRRQGTVDETIFMMGSFNASAGIYYNKSLVTEELLASIGLAVPSSPISAWTWEEFELALQAFAGAHPDKHGLIIDFDTSSADADEFLTFSYLPIIYSNGQEVMDPILKTMSGLLDSAGSVAALERFSSFIHNSLNTIDQETTSISDISSASTLYLSEFREGRAAFCWTGHWLYNILKGDYDPSSGNWMGGIGEDLAIMPLPRFDGEDPHSPFGSYGWALSSRTLNSGPAFQLIKFLTSPESQKAFIEGVGEAAGSGAIPTTEKARVIIEPYSQCALTDCDATSLPAEQDDRCVFLQQLRCTAKERPITPAYLTFTAGFADVIRLLAIEPRADLGSALSTVAEDTDSELVRLLEQR